MNPSMRASSPVEAIRERFLVRTGLPDVETRTEVAGPETFLRFVVGRDAPVYRRVLGEINRELDPEHAFYGRLSLDVQRGEETLTSPEVQVLRSLITRSLRVTAELAEGGETVEFMPFRGGHQNRVVQPANHAILGRRGVGKSSLILLAYKKLRQRGDVPVWIDLQPYHGRTDGEAVVDIVLEVLREAMLGSKKQQIDTTPLHAAGEAVESARAGSALTGVPDRLKRVAPQLRTYLREFTRKTRRQLFIFLDDSHVLGAALQPHLFAFLHAVTKGANAWLQIAGVRNLTRLYESTTGIGLQAPHDVQVLSLDLTLDDPAAAREHLTGVLQSFLSECGFSHPSAVIGDSAIERLVWCSAGVPRDFLALFERAVGVAVQQRRKRVGVQDVNVVVGEFGQGKIAELDQDATEEGEILRQALDRIQEIALNENRANSFLARLNTKHPGYQLLQKLVDLRLIHLIHPSVTLRRAGERYEAFLLDYSFYTGVRRRQHISELKISAEQPPRYAALRRLRRIDLDRIAGDVGRPERSVK